MKLCVKQWWFNFRSRRLAKRLVATATPTGSRIKSLAELNAINEKNDWSRVNAQEVFGQAYRDAQRAGADHDTARALGSEALIKAGL